MAFDTDQTLLIEVARLYYEHQMSQQEIADKIGTSRPSISRLLRQARDEGFVKITIIDPTQHGSRLEHALTEKFGLKKVIVVPSEKRSDHETKKRLGQAAARYLNEVVFDNCILGVSWGTTMRQIVHHLNPKPVQNMTVVQAVGGITYAEFDPHASEIAQKVGENYQAKSYFLLLPAIIDKIEVKRAMVSDKRIKETLDLIRKADIVVCSVGTFSPDSLLIRSGYFNAEEVEYLKKMGTVGDICSRMINGQGNISWPELDARTVAIELDDLKKIPCAIAVAGGMEKTEAIRAGLQARHFNVLITDEDVADYLLNLNTDQIIC